MATHPLVANRLLLPQFGVLVGSVQFPPPPGAPAPAAGANGAAAAPADNDLASALVKAGLARTAEWGLNMMTTGSFRLRELGGFALLLFGLQCLQRCVCCSRKLRVRGWQRGNLLPVHSACCCQCD